MKFAQKPLAPAPVVRPHRVVVFPPSAFADDYAAKPATEVAIGLRFISQSDVDTGRREAMRESVGFYSELRGTPIPADPEVAVDVYNDALMAHAVARGTCDPNDVSKPYFKAAEDVVRIALTPAGMRRLYDELVLLTKGHSPGLTPAPDEDVRRLATKLRRGGAQLDDESRKMLGYLFAKHGGLDEPDEDDGMFDEDVAVYSAHAS